MPALKRDTHEPTTSRTSAQLINKLREEVDCLLSGIVNEYKIDPSQVKDEGPGFWKLLTAIAREKLTASQKAKKSKVSKGAQKIKDLCVKAQCIQRHTGLSYCEIFDLIEKSPASSPFAFYCDEARALIPRTGDQGRPKKGHERISAVATRSTKGTSQDPWYRAWAPLKAILKQRAEGKEKRLTGFVHQQTSGQIAPRELHNFWRGQLIDTAYERAEWIAALAICGNEYDAHILLDCQPPAWTVRDPELLLVREGNSISIEVSLLDNESVKTLTD